MNLSLLLVLLFYISIILIVYLNKNRFQIYGKIIAMYRTHVGIKSMAWLAKYFPRTVKGLGYIGIVVGFLGMIYISYVLVEGAFLLLTNPDAQPVVSPVIPGVKIPGAPLFVPFWYGIIGIFIVAAIHEFSHGVVSTAHNVKVRNTGIVFFGPILGAFVEPDESDIKRLSWVKQVSIFCAGPFSNVLTGIVVLFLLGYAIAPLASSMVSSDGIFLNSIESGYPAENAGLKSGFVVHSINDVPVVNASDLNSVMDDVNAGDVLELSDGSQSYSVKTVANPKNESLPYLGVTLSQNYKIKESVSNYLGNTFPWGIFYIMDLMKWIFILSVGIGLANLLPLGPADGGRIVQTTLDRLLPLSRSRKIWKTVSLAFIFLLLFNLLFPYVKYIF